MTKEFITIFKGEKRLKLDPKEIQKVSMIKKRKTPKIPNEWECIGH